jgi:glycosyltransferase involved in cell wall biosynthesis
MHQNRLSASGATEKDLDVQRVAICTVGELFGGVERHILGIIKALRERRITVVLVLFHDGELALQARAQGVEPVILPNDNLSVLTTSRRLARLLEGSQVPYVHVHGYKATVFCALARYWYPFAMIKTAHGLPEPLSGRRMIAVFDRLYHLLDGAATRMAGTAVCYVTEELRGHYHRIHSGLRAVTIPNGVANLDRRHFPRPAELKQEWFNLTIIGRVDEVKGLNVAIQAMAVAEMPPDVHLHILGTGPCEAALRVLAETCSVADRVHFLGFRRNIYDYIAHCQALVMPSLHEGLPYTLLEAMALGTPIVASRVGGLAEALDDGVTSLLIEPGDSTALAHAITRLHRNSDLRERLGENAKRLQQTRYSQETMTEHYLALYRGLPLDPAIRLQQMKGAARLEGR